MPWDPGAWGAPGHKAGWQNWGLPKRYRRASGSGRAWQAARAACALGMYLMRWTAFKI